MTTPNTPAIADIAREAALHLRDGLFTPLLISAVKPTEAEFLFDISSAIQSAIAKAIERDRAERDAALLFTAVYSGTGTFSILSHDKLVELVIGDEEQTREYCRELNDYLSGIKSALRNRENELAETKAKLAERDAEADFARLHHLEWCESRLPHIEADLAAQELAHKETAQVAWELRQQLAERDTELNRLREELGKSIDRELVQAKTIAEREAELAECRKECEEQARLNGMGSEREARLMAKLAEQSAELLALRADKARLDWLEEHKSNFECTSSDSDWVVFLPHVRSTGVPTYTRSTLRAAIDAALNSPTQGAK